MVTLDCNIISPVILLMLYDEGSWMLASGIKSIKDAEPMENLMDGKTYQLP